MNNNDENEWGWFITLDIDTTHESNSKKSDYYKNFLQLNIRNNKLQSIDENRELNVITKITIPNIPNTKNIMYYKNININHIGNSSIGNTSISENNKDNKIKILNYNTYKRITIYWLYYSYIFIEYIYKYMNPLLCFKSETKTLDKINNI